MAISAIGLFLWEYRLEISKGTIETVAIAEAQTMAVTTVMFFQIFYLFHCRSYKLGTLRIGFFSNPILLIGVGFVLLAQVAFVHMPLMNRLFHSSGLDLFAWLVSLGVSLAVFLLVILGKIIRTSLKT